MLENYQFNVLYQSTTYIYIYFAIVYISCIIIKFHFSTVKSFHDGKGSTAKYFLPERGTGFGKCKYC